MSLLRAFARDSVLYTVPTVVSRGISFFLLPIYTRILSPTDYGAFDLVGMLGALVNLVVALEVSQGVARFYTPEKDPARKRTYASASLWFTLGAYIVFLIPALWFSRPLSAWLFQEQVPALVLQLGIVYFFFNGIFYLVQQQFRWDLRSKGFVIISLTHAVVTAAAAVTLAWGFGLGLPGILMGMIAGSVAAGLYGLLALRGVFGFAFDMGALKEMLKFSIPLVPAVVAGFVSSHIDRAMILYFLALDQLGLYGIAFRIAALVGLALVGVRGALTPLIYHHYQEPETPQRLADIFRWFTVLLLIGFTGLSLFSAELLRLLTTPAFYPAFALTVFLVPAVIFSNLYMFAPGIALAKKTHIILWISLAGMILNGLLNAILIPLLGIQGAAFATMISLGCMFVAKMYWSQRFYRVPHAWIRIVPAAVISFVLVWLTAQLLGLEVGWQSAAVKAVVVLLVIVVVFGFKLVRVAELRWGLVAIRPWNRG